MNSTARRGVGGLTMAGVLYVNGSYSSKGKPTALRGVVRPDGVT